MFSKEEIEKAKEKLSKYVDKVNRNKRILEGSEIQTSETIKTLLQYIDQLEQENKTLKFIQECDTDRTNQLEQENDKLNKINDEMVDMISSLGFTINIAAFGGQARFGGNEEVKQYFEKKVEEDKNE